MHGKIAGKTFKAKQPNHSRGELSTQKQKLRIADSRNAPKIGYSKRNAEPEEQKQSGSEVQVRKN